MSIRKILKSIHEANATVILVIFMTIFIGEHLFFTMPVMANRLPKGGRS